MEKGISRAINCKYRWAAPICLFLMLLVIKPGFIHAQDLRQISLLGWEEQKKMMLLDRYHNYGSIFYDRGLFRFTTPPMIEHHDLDLITYGFSEIDDHRWFYNRETGFRAFGGSFNVGEYLHGAELRHDVSISENLNLPMHSYRRYDMRQDRMLLTLGLDYNLHGQHTIGLQHTLTEQKPDLDATLYYRFRDLPSGGIQLEFTALDWANNPAYNLGQRRGDVIPEMRKYEQSPFLFSMKAVSPDIRNVRGELVAGIQTPLQAVAESLPEKSDESFRDRDRARYIGALVQYAVPGFTAALSWRHTYTRFNRTNAEAGFSEPVDYGNEQTRQFIGGFVSLSYRNFHFDNWIWYNFNRDRQFDRFETRFLFDEQVYPFHYREDRWMMRNRVSLDPGERGFKIAIEWSADYRNPLSGIIERPDGSAARGLPYHLQYPYSIGERNERLTLFLGYRFTEHTFIIFGASADLDREVFVERENRRERIRPTIFDGGFGRLVFYWN